MANILITLDAMGGDYGVSITVPAAMKALERYPELQLILVGDKDIIQQELTKHAINDNSRLKVVNTSDTVKHLSLLIINSQDDLKDISQISIENNKKFNYKFTINGSFTDGKYIIKAVYGSIVEKITLTILNN